jgi:hypothetical protein
MIFLGKIIFTEMALHTKPWKLNPMFIDDDGDVWGPAVGRWEALLWFLKYKEALVLKLSKRPRCELSWK